MCTLAVERLFIKWFFGEDYCFSKGLQSTIPGDYCFNGRLDFQGVCFEKMEKLLSKTIHQWLFLVPIKGGRWHSSVYTTYIPLIYWLLGDYMPPIPPFRGTSFPTIEFMVHLCFSPTRLAWRTPKSHVDQAVENLVISNH